VSARVHHAQGQPFRWAEYTLANTHSAGSADEDFSIENAINPGIESNRSDVADRSTVPCPIIRYRPSHGANFRKSPLPGLILHDPSSIAICRSTRP